MSISKETRQWVRQRANFICEYCGISETDAGSELTLDHYQPIQKGGDDSPDNLVYCCHRCNEYKSDYFPVLSNHPFLWNPRHTPASQHFIELEDGTIKGLTTEGEFTIQLLRLNRAQLVAYRIKRKNEHENRQLLKQLLELSELMKQTNDQVKNLSQHQQTLLDEQMKILKILTNKDT